LTDELYIFYCFHTLRSLSLHLSPLYPILAGDGVQRDYPLAKRFFDQAATYDPAAQLPAAIARAMLKVLQTILITAPTFGRFVRLMI
jgi:hypothetical protein